jgi:multiple sugar transport system substrate-binding protein
VCRGTVGLSNKEIGKETNEKKGEGMKKELQDRGTAQHHRAWRRRSVVSASVVTLVICCSTTATVAAPRLSNAAGTGGVITEQDYYTAADDTLMVGFVKQFEQLNPGFSVQRDLVPNSSMESQVLTEAAAHQLPDVLMMDNPWVPELAAAGDLVPLTSLGISTAGKTGGAIEAGTYHGQFYGLGFGNNTIGLFYNKSLLAASGVAVPTTWAQLLVAAKTLTKNGLNGLEVAAQNTSGNAVWQFLPFFWTAGGSLSDVDNAGGVKALTLYSELAKEGALPTSSVNATQNSIAVDFQGGRAAMIVMGPWEFADFSATKGLDYGVASIPAPAAGMSPVGPLGGEVWVIPKSTPAKEALGLRFLKFLTSPATTYTWASENGEVASQKSVESELLAKVPLDRVFAQEIETARARTSQVGLAYPTIETALGTAVQDAILGKGTPASDLEAAQVAVEAALKTYHVF